MIKKFSEILEANRDAVIDLMKDAYRDSLERPDMQWTIYINDDGSVDYLEQPAGGNWVYGELLEGLCEIVYTFNNQYWNSSIMIETTIEDTIEWLVSEMDNGGYDEIIDRRIEELRRDENYMLDKMF